MDAEREPWFPALRERLLEAAGSQQTPHYEMPAYMQRDQQKTNAAWGEFEAAVGAAEALHQIIRLPIGATTQQARDIAANALARAARAADSQAKATE